MPERVAEDFKNSAELALRCGVSEKTAQIRLEDIARRKRLERGELRPLPLTEKGLSYLAELYKTADVQPKNADLQAFLSRRDAASNRAEQLNFLPYSCGHCGELQLIQEGGCTTCKACGESDCN